MARRHGMEMKNIYNRTNLVQLLGIQSLPITGNTHTVVLYIAFPGISQIFFIVIFTNFALVSGIQSDLLCIQRMSLPGPLDALHKQVMSLDSSSI